MSTWATTSPGGREAARTGGAGAARPGGWGPPGYWWEEGGRSTPFEIFGLSGEENIEEGKINSNTPDPKGSVDDGKRAHACLKLIQAL